MYILPAIDLLGGKVVRLAQGDYARVTVYDDDPVERACAFDADGAQWLHVVDLDGARSGEPCNTDAIARIARETSDLRIEVGGGLRSLASIERVLQAGATRAILGSKLARDPDFVSEAVATFGADALVAGIDARDGEVAVEGWMQTSGITATDLTAALASWGLRHLVYTDIARDGMQSGIAAELYRAVAQAAGFPVIVSGGVATLDDISAAAALGDSVVEGVIVGRALYEGAFTLSQARARLEQEK
ncbi:MAG: 1-(5-phosphoribosyl)-5-[(5-phosphoribosylamino)methylideneamino]imidazole-4-carboxamide isomerase [Actinomycetia bacterium]|nr:1-(5-phosphoribosyl)-5-[(5-phosphoribosylamino)methylideneamino]imidazole-4-carboxamide isomerase [Actinomycetes bacterium]